MQGNTRFVAILLCGFLLFGCIGTEGSGSEGGDSGSEGGGSSGGNGGDIYNVGGNAGEGGLHPGESPYEIGSTIPMSEVVRHTSLGDCWIVIHNKVYDVDAYIGEHPGGDAMLQGCGKDATELFESKPGSGNSHSEYARGVLGEHYVGELGG